MPEDGSRFAWELVRGGVDYRTHATRRARRSVLLDGETGREYNANAIDAPLFSRDKRHVLYRVAGVEGKYDLMVADGAESRHYDEITNLHLSADGTEAVFVARAESQLLRVSYSLK